LSDSSHPPNPCPSLAELHKSPCDLCSSPSNLNSPCSGCSRWSFNLGSFSSPNDNVYVLANPARTWAYPFSPPIPPAFPIERRLTFFQCSFPVKVCPLLHMSPCFYSIGPRCLLRRPNGFLHLLFPIPPLTSTTFFSLSPLPGLNRTFHQ